MIQVRHTLSAASLPSITEFSEPISEADEIESVSISKDILRHLLRHSLSPSGSVLILTPFPAHSQVETIPFH